MDTTLNWSRLYDQGRCRAVGVPWTDEDLKAIKLGVPVEYVRLNILTPEDYQAKLANEPIEEVPLFKKSKQELIAILLEKGMTATPDASKETLIQQIEQIDEPEKVHGKKLRGRRK